MPFNVNGNRLAIVNFDNEADALAFKENHKYRPLSKAEKLIFGENLCDAGSIRTRIEGSTLEDAIISYTPVSLEFVKEQALATIKDSHGHTLNELTGNHPEFLS